MKHKLGIAAILLLLITSCGSNNPDRKAAEMLETARAAMRHHNYKAARDSILSMRIKYPTAIQARRQGILLLDSVEMLAATDSLKSVSGEEWERLNVKKQFFERKLKEDLKKENQ